MKQDIFGQMNSLTHADSVAAWDGVLLGFMAHSAVTPQHLGAVLQAEAQFALGHAIKGIFTLLLGRRELYPVAAEALSTAEHAMQAAPVSAREALYVEALRLWLAGQPITALTRFETILDTHPALFWATASACAGRSNE